MRTEPFAVVGMLAFFVLIAIICEFIPMPYSFIAFVCLILCILSMGIVGLNAFNDD